jgi:hypothetical protein
LRRKPWRTTNRLARAGKGPQKARKNPPPARLGARHIALVKQVADMTEEQKAALVARIGAVPTCEGHALSLANTMLLLMQMPNVSMVGGFRQWLRAGRCVQKGQHGAMIWIPLGKRKNGEPDATDEEDPIEEAPKTNGNGKGRFIIGTVFDISQTAPRTDPPSPRLRRDEQAPAPAPVPIPLPPPPPAPPEPKIIPLFEPAPAVPGPVPVVLPALPRWRRIA